MRKVKFSITPPKGCGATYETEGFFHGWFPSALESRDGNVNFTIAIVEDKHGKLHELGPTAFVFLTPLTEQNATQ